MPVASGGDICKQKNVQGRIILTEDCVAEGAAWLARRETGFARVLPLLGPLPLRREADGFAAPFARHCRPAGFRG